LDGRVSGRKVKVNDRKGERSWRDLAHPKIFASCSNSGIEVFVERRTHY